MASRALAKSATLSWPTRPSPSWVSQRRYVAMVRKRASAVCEATWLGKDGALRRWLSKEATLGLRWRGPAASATSPRCSLAAFTNEASSPEVR